MRFRLLLGLLILSTALAVGLFEVQPRREFTVAILDVGQGDAIFISTPGGHQILVDAGPDGTASRSLGRLMPFYDRELDLMVLTHPHADHYVGFVSVLERYRVKSFLWGGTSGEAPEYRLLEEGLRKRGIKPTVADHRLAFDFGDGVRLETWYPNRPLGKLENPNDTSIELSLSYGTNTVLLTGDFPEGRQRELVRGTRLPDATVLKVPHQGARDGLALEFLGAVRPETAVISVGAKNHYGHPVPETLSKLHMAGVKTYRTDQDGTVKLTSRAGELFEVRTHALGD